MNDTAMTPGQKLEAARQAIRAGEVANRSEATMRKLWKAYFAAEDAVKAAGVWS